MQTKAYILSQTSNRSATVNDVVLQSPNKKNVDTRQIVRCETIFNSRNPDDSLHLALIHQKSDKGQWLTKYTDLRRIEAGESIRIQLDTAQTKHLFSVLQDCYQISKNGVGDGKRIVISGVDDIAKLVVSQNANKAQLLLKVAEDITEEQLTEFLSSGNTLKSVLSKLPRLRIDILEKLKSELCDRLSQNETAIQAWLDQDPKVNCLIFGLEFIDYRRETQFGNSYFDLLTEQTGTEHVIVELKSPNVELFKIKKVQTKNGQKNEYVLSEDLGEAIPQIIKYFEEYRRENDETFKKNGIQRKKIAKGIVVIGRNHSDDLVWQEHYIALRHRLSGIEIITYDHLVEKMERQITNLKNLDS